MLRVSGRGRRGRDDRGLTVVLITLSAAAPVVLALEGLQAHRVEGVQLLAAQLLSQTRSPVAEPHLNPSFRQFRSAIR